MRKPTIKRSVLKLGAACMIVASLLGVERAASQSLAADVIYTRGTVLTMDAGASVAEAVAVRRGEIVAVGSDREVRRLTGSGTRVVDLGGRTLMPGFYAPHDHFPGAGVLATRLVNLGSPPMGGMETIDDVVEALRQRAAETPEGEWIQGRGYDDTLLREGRHPTRQDLDRASTRHPIWISHTSGHLGVANSLALRQAGVTRNTPQPPGGRIQKDANGEPNGVFEESGGMVSRLIPPMTDAQRLEGFRRAVAIYVAKGVTTTVVTGGGAGSFANLQAARDSGILKIRVIQMASRRAVGCRSGGPRHRLRRYEDQGRRHQDRAGRVEPGVHGIFHGAVSHAVPRGRELARLPEAEPGGPDRDGEGTAPGGLPDCDPRERGCGDR
jgi:predicted amidohydrolase YtcJ